MKKHQLRPALVVFALFGFGVFASPSSATTANWTNAAATNAWETAGNWDINQVPNNNTFDVTIPIAAPCNLSGDFQIGALNLSVSTARLNLVPGSRLPIAGGSFNNSGTIVVNTTGANTTTVLRFDASCSITGTGSILLNGFGSNFNVADFDLNSRTVTIPAGQTLHGHGTVLSNGGLLINNGTISGDDAGGGNMQLTLVYNDGVLHKNNGTIKAINGGVLGLYSGIMDQTGGGSFLADGNGSIVQIGGDNFGGVVGATVIGGTLNTTNGGIIQIVGGNGALLTSSTNNGAIQIPGNRTLSVKGTGLTNNGTILVNSTDPANSTSILQFIQSGTLGGTGSILLNGIGFNRGNLTFANGSTLTIGANQTISGRGTIIGDGLFVNNGTIIGDDAAGNSMQIDFVYNDSVLHKNNGLIKAINGGVVGLYSGIMDQTGGGSFLADGNGSIVQIGGTNNGGVVGATVIGGTLNTTNGGVIQIVGGNSALLNGSTNNGAIQIPGGKTLFVSGTGLTNNGTILVDTAADNLTTKIFFNADGTLGGTGSVTLNGILNAFNVAGFDCNGHNVINGANHTIKGNGDIFMNGGVLNNNGAIAPGSSAGQLNVFGNLVLGSTSNLSMEVGGTAPATQYDVLNKTDAAQLVLAGTLSVRLINGFTPAAANTFTIVTTQTALGGAFSNVASGQRLSNADGTGSFIVTYSGNNVVLSSFQPTPPPSRLLNIATRLRVQTGENVLIGGFIITGTDTKTVIIRGIGPSLSQLFAGTLADPTLDLFQGNTLLESNDNWKLRSDGSSQQAAVVATGIPPSNDLESAIVRTLPPGAYTAILRGKNSIGIGVVEAYDLNQTSDSKLANIATRGFVDGDDNVMIGGLIVGPANGASTKIVVRAIGPSLGNFGIAGALQDPTLELHDGSGATLAVNDNWKTRSDGSSQEAEVAATGLQPGDDRESVLLQTVPPGNYTAIVRGKNNTTGVGLVEVYNIP